ncbi:MAG: amino acid racemase [Muribaculaceae bacterium]|nr:amino acid racemase [Muribaculaceae bacterium]
MKKLGMVGGMGPESTLSYYRDIVFGVNARVGADVFPHVAIESLSVFYIQQLIREERMAELTDYLMGAITNLARCGADFVVLTANTAHIVFDRLQEQSPVPLISIVDATCRHAVRQGYRRLGLLGTCFTMERDFFKEPFRRHGIEIVVPEAADRELVNQRISTELEFGVIKEETLAEFQQIIERMRARDGIEGVILGCTELPLLLNDGNMPLPCLDTVKIHVEEIIREIMKRS